MAEAAAGGRRDWRAGAVAADASGSELSGLVLVGDAVGTRIYLDLRVKVPKNWQRDPKQLGRAWVLRAREVANGGHLVAVPGDSEAA